MEVSTLSYYFFDINKIGRNLSEFSSAVFESIFPIQMSQGGRACVKTLIL
jgi:hypothetical protein